MRQPPPPATFGIYLYGSVQLLKIQCIRHIKKSPLILSMLYKQDIFLQKYCKRVKEEPFSWKELLKPIRLELPKNSVLDLNSMKLVM